MRLDKYLAESGLFSRSEAGKAVRMGRIAVDNVVCKDPSLHIADTAWVTCDGARVSWSKYKYIMLHKPAGYISATEELDKLTAENGRTVMHLLPPACTRLGMFPCGRLDRDTTGLLLITNDGPGAHFWLSPKSHVAKTYAYTCDAPLTEEHRRRLEEGLSLGDFCSQPAVVIPDANDRHNGKITITEGKYHQIKRMFHAVGLEITALARLSFGPLTLDPALAPGEWRELTDAEKNALTALAAGQN